MIEFSILPLDFLKSLYKWILLISLCNYHSIYYKLYHELECLNFVLHILGSVFYGTFKLITDHYFSLITVNLETLYDKAPENRTPVFRKEQSTFNEDLLYCK